MVKSPAANHQTTTRYQPEDRMDLMPPTLPAELAPILSVSPLGESPLAWIPAAAVPAPYQQLLVHDHDMTSELAAFHRDEITLEVLHSRQSGDTYLREVVLHTASVGTPVEYGLIEIQLAAFPADLRPLILAGQTPLGAILNASGLAYRSEPQGFFTVPAKTLDRIFSPSPSGAILFGRYNHLVCGESTCLARILEILPAAKTSHPDHV
jgi:hypothetical protein